MEYWKYGASVGISACPMAYVNGVKLEGYPQNENEWEKLIHEARHPVEDSSKLMRDYFPKYASPEELDFLQ